MNRALAFVVASFVLALSSGCPTVECAVAADCRDNETCSLDGLCVQTDVEPEPAPSDDAGPPPVVDAGPPPLVDAGGPPDAGPPPAFDAGAPPDAGPLPPPFAWHCDASLYDDEKCDCGCGAQDPDCGDVEPAVCATRSCGPGFTPGGTIDPAEHALCLVPGAWTCDAAWFNDGDCDCGCGAQDLGCGEATDPGACDFVWCEEDNAYGGKPLEGDLAQCDVVVPELLLASHHRHTCAILPSDVVKCWGRNEYGQLGKGNTQDIGAAPAQMGAFLAPVPLGADPNGDAVIPARISTGNNDSCVLSTTGFVKCWGRNEFGLAGRGDTNTIGNDAGEMGPALASVPLGTGVTALEVAVGRHHACARVNAAGAGNNRVKCWGKGDNGRLGYMDPDDSSLVHRGNHAGEMGDALPFVDLGTVDGTPGGAPLGAKRVFAGGQSSCAILEDDTLKCWGRNEVGELGIGDTNNRGNSPGEMGNSLPRVNLGGGERVVSVAMGHEHICALLESGNVKCWGAGGGGRLGSEGTTNLGGNGATTPDQLPVVAITDASGVPLAVQAIAAGDDHTCVVVDPAGAPAGANVKCWGGNGAGELGHGDTAAKGGAPGAMGAALPFTDVGGTAVTLAAGLNHTCALLDDGAVKCWGAAEDGALGNGSPTENLGDGPGESGADLPVVSLE